MRERLKTFSVLSVLLLVMFVEVGVSQEVISARRLYNYSPDNEYVFDKAFKGKTFKVKGTVYGGIEKDITGHYYMLLEGGLLSNVCVQLFFSSSTAHQLEDIESNDEVTIEGRCVGRGIAHQVQLESCRIVRHVSQAALARAEAERDRAAALEARRRAELEREAEVRRREAEEAREAERKAKWEAERPQREAEQKERSAERIAEWAERRKEENRIWWEEEGRKRQEEEGRKREEEQRRQKEEERKAGVVKRTFKFGEGKETAEILTLSRSELRPQYAISQQEGIIVIDVVVEVVKTLVPAGMVTKAKIDEKRTTIKDQAIRNSALEKVRREKFPTVTQRTKGTVTYTFSHR